jgi:hypothetical protein
MQKQHTTIKNIAEAKDSNSLPFISHKHSERVGSFNLFSLGPVWNIRNENAGIKEGTGTVDVVLGKTPEHHVLGWGGVEDKSS